MHGHTTHHTPHITHITSHTGKAIFFDNDSVNNARVLTPNISGLATEFSIAFWTKFHRPGDSASGDFSGYSGTVFSFVDEASTKTILQFAEYNDLTLNVGATDSISLFENGEDTTWHHYAFTYNDSSGIIVFYRDGNMTWSNEDIEGNNNNIDLTFNAAKTAFMQTGYFLLGSSRLASDTPFTGFLDEFCVWRASLSISSVQFVMQNGCLNSNYLEGSNLAMRLGFDKDTQNSTSALPNVWNDVSGEFDSTTAVIVECVGLEQGKYPFHIISSAPFECDNCPMWAVVTRNETTRIDLLCHGCVEIEILQLPLVGKLFTLEGIELSAGNLTHPSVMYEAGELNVDLDWFGYGYGSTENSTVMVKTNTPPIANSFSISVSQNSFLVASIPAKGTSIDSESGPPLTSWIVSIASSFEDPEAVSLFQYQDSNDCDLPNWDFYQCIATDTNRILFNTTATTTTTTASNSYTLITDRFYRIGIMHTGDVTGNGAITITYQVSDGLTFATAVGVVQVDIIPVNRNPVSNGVVAMIDLGVIVNDTSAEATTIVTATEDTDLYLLIDATDFESEDVLIVVTELPKHGALYQVDSNGRIDRQIILDQGSVTFDQWAVSAVASSEWPNPINYANQIVGPADAYPNHGDIAGAWQPMETSDFVHSWIELNISTPVYLATADIYETWHPGSSVKLSAFVEDLNLWRILWHGPSRVSLLNPDPTKTKSGISSIAICPSIYTTRQLRFDLDLGSNLYWAGWDAVSVGGALEQRPQIVLDQNRRIVYKPSPNYNGPDSFSYILADCAKFLTYHSLTNTQSKTIVINITVADINDSPNAYPQDIYLTDGPNSVVNIVLLGDDVDDSTLTYAVTVLPATGKLWDEFGIEIASVPTSLPENSTRVVYRPVKSSSDVVVLTIGFSVTDPHGASNSSSVHLSIQSCASFHFTTTVSSLCDFSTLRRSIHQTWGEHSTNNSYSNANSSTCNGYALAPSSTPCDHIPAKSIIGAVVVFTTLITCAFCTFWLAWLSINRTLPIVRASQYVVCMLFVVGALLFSLSNLVFLGPNSDVMCMSRVWAFHVSFTFMFGPLAMKIWRAYQILQNSAFKRRSITNRDVVKWLCCMSLFDVSLLSLWTAISPQRTTVDHVTSAAGIITNHVCVGSNSNSQIFSILLSTYKVMMCIGACFWSFQTRNVNQQFAESKHIMFAVYNAGLVGGIAVFVIYVAGISGGSGMLFHSLGVAITVSVAVAVVLVPKYQAQHLTTQALLAANLNIPAQPTTTTTTTTTTTNTTNTSTPTANRRFTGALSSLQTSAVNRTNKHSGQLNQKKHSKSSNSSNNNSSNSFLNNNRASGDNSKQHLAVCVYESGGGNGGKKKSGQTRRMANERPSNNLNINNSNGNNNNNDDKIIRTNSSSSSHNNDISMNRLNSNNSSNENLNHDTTNNNTNNTNIDTTNNTSPQVSDIRILARAARSKSRNSSSSDITNTNTTTNPHNRLRYTATPVEMLYEPVLAPRASLASTFSTLRSGPLTTQSRTKSSNVVSSSSRNLDLGEHGHGMAGKLSPVAHVIEL